MNGYSCILIRRIILLWLHNLGYDQGVCIEATNHTVEYLRNITSLLHPDQTSLDPHPECQARLSPHSRLPFIYTSCCAMHTAARISMTKYGGNQRCSRIARGKAWTTHPFIPQFAASVGLLSADLPLHYLLYGRHATQCSRTM